LRLLICGLGSIGYRHLKVIKSIGDHTVDAFRTGKSTIPGDIEPDNQYSNLNEALEAKPDGAIICNPNNLHIPVAIKIVEKGIPVLIEKPLSHDNDNIELLEDIIYKNKVDILIGVNLRHHAGIITLHNLLKNESIGRVVSARAHFGTFMPDWHPWEDYKKSFTSVLKIGGVIRTHIHEIDYLLSLFGSVKDVKAFEIGGDVIGIEAEEGVEILMKHKSSVVSSVHLNFFQKPYQRFCTIVGTEGTLHWNFLKPEVQITNLNGTETITLGSDSDSLLNESYKQQMIHFLDIIGGNAKPIADLQSGIESLKVSLNILKIINRV